MLTLAKRFDAWLHSHLILLLALLAVVALRIPNFFEPYWYGDEGIYLTVGNGIKDGERLYAEIIDHKTPIIYYLAAVPNQLSFRVLTLLWMLVTTSAFYAIARKLISNKRALYTALALFVALTTLPWFEGNIPNGELFVMGFVLVGGWLLTKTRLFALFLNQRQYLRKVYEPGLLFTAGVCMGLAVLTKIPAVLDLGAFLTIGWFGLTNHLSESNRKHLLHTIPKHLLILGLGVITPIIASVLYFIAIGAGQEYLQFGLLYNFRYAATWGLPFQSLLLEQLFTLQGKIIITGAIILLVTIRKKWFSPAMQFTIAWFVLALTGSLLSNRPYPHYFQQLVPPLAILTGLIIQKLSQLPKQLPSLLVGSGVMGLFVAALLLLDFSPYPTVQYYRQFYQLATNQISKEEYRNSFNYLMKDNYTAAEIIQQSGVDEIFIWGTNPMLYALSHTQPTGRFTVSFHIKDFNAYEETYQDLEAASPEFIIVMNDETAVLPGLDGYLQQHYAMSDNFDHFIMWKRLPDELTVL